MKYTLLLIAFLFPGTLLAQLPQSDSSSDWLISAEHQAATLELHDDGTGFTFSNGLVSRTFHTTPNAATVGFDNLIQNTSVIRAVKPELRVQLNGKWYDVGGLTGQENQAYLLPEWIEEMESDPSAFQYEGYEIGPLKAHLDWKQSRYSGNTTWPPPGKQLSLSFTPPASLASEHPGLKLTVHYNLYEGLPLMAKWFTIENDSQKPIHVDAFVAEVLATVEAESFVEHKGRWELPPLHVQSDYSFGGSPDHTTHWLPDSTYLTQVNYRLQTPTLLESKPRIGPAVDIPAGDTFTSFRTYELLFDSGDRERRGLAIRRMYRAISPWVTENPIFMHVRNADSESIRRAVDQSAEVGFEMVILTFGSGIDMENLDPSYLAQIKADVDYAHSKGIELGAYSLLASRSISEEHDVINPETGKTGGAIFNNSPCLQSEWGLEYFGKIKRFIQETGLSVLEHDGNYPGDVCASTSHPGHRYLDDSQWTQWEKIGELYSWALANGVYLNVPDFYFLNGSTKAAMGYRETNWSLPRAQQLIHARQNIFDGTWKKTPSMGWMFVPLVEYHGGGAAATMEPLSEHLDTYEAQLANLFGAGVMAAYRGPRLYDTLETKAVVKKWVDFYKKHRSILDSDLIHLRRANGLDYDGYMHVNSQIDHKGLAMFYNPTDEIIEKTISLPLYYTGLTELAEISEQGGVSKSYSLNRDYSVNLAIRIPPNSHTWFVIE